MMRTGQYLERVLEECSEWCLIKNRKMAYV